MSERNTVSNSTEAESLCVCVYQIRTGQSPVAHGRLIARQCHPARIDREPQPRACAPQGRVLHISKLMALAIHFQELLQDGVVEDQSDLARLSHVTQPRITQIKNLLLLATEIQ